MIWFLDVSCGGYSKSRVQGPLVQVIQSLCNWSESCVRILSKTLLPSYRKEPAEVVQASGCQLGKSHWRCSAHFLIALFITFICTKSGETDLIHMCFLNRHKDIPEVNICALFSCRDNASVRSDT